jgi:hypothetical protein
MKKLFKSESKIPKYIVSKTPKDVIEKKFILNFFKELPVESLKKLINFKEIDFESNELWDIPENREMLRRLREENVVKYTCELDLDTDS